MKAPDKIYIKTKASGAFSSKWTTIPFRNFENTVYIRKEALVERINKQILFYKNSVSVNDYEEGCDKGAIAALEHVVRSL